MTISKNVWKIAALLLVLSLISFTMISGTFARYTSTFAGTDTALVAKWDITSSGDGIFGDVGTGQTLDLFNHLYDENIATEEGINIIAPGVKDEFVIEFKNSSDVAADINFEIGRTGNADVPIVYEISAGGGTHYTVGDLETALNGIFNVVDMDETITRTISWEWPLEGNNEGDTDLGEASYASVDLTGNRTSYGLVVTATAIQMTPGAITAQP